MSGLRGSRPLWDGGGGAKGRYMRTIQPGGGGVGIFWGTVHAKSAVTRPSTTLIWPGGASHLMVNPPPP